MGFCDIGLGIWQGAGKPGLNRGQTADEARANRERGGIKPGTSLGQTGDEPGFRLGSGGDGGRGNHKGCPATRGEW